VTDIVVFVAMIPGRTNQEATQLNIESLWSGGPFQDPVGVPYFWIGVSAALNECIFR